MQRSALFQHLKDVKVKKMKKLALIISALKVFMIF